LANLTLVTHNVNGFVGIGVSLLNLFLNLVFAKLPTMDETKEAFDLVIFNSFLF